MLIAIALLLQGCLLLPFFQSAHEMGATESDRQQLLSDRVKDFHSALYWGAPGKAINFVAPAARSAVAPSLKSDRDSEKIVESTVRDIQFSESSKIAKIEVVTRFFRVPYYIVKERTEREEWRFSFGDGWMLTGRTIDADPAAEPH